MSNTNIFRGSDAIITLSAGSGEEGAAAGSIISTFSLTPVGRATGVEVYVHNELLEYHEIGQRHAVQLRGGNVHVSGKLTRAYLNGALLRLLLGQGAIGGTSGPIVEPTFNIQLSMTDPALAGSNSTLTVHGAKLENWSYALPEDDFVMESVTFKALRISVTDVPGTTP